jgi:hypothetical protein
MIVDLLAVLREMRAGSGRLAAAVLRAWPRQMPFGAARWQDRLQPL